MDDQIQLRIAEISEKVNVLVQKLSDLKSENDNLLAELNTQAKLNSDLNTKHKMDLESALSAAQSNVTDSNSKSSMKRNKEIDALVREIEICIDELKK
jgi:regulator of replication initiation timing